MHLFGTMKAPSKRQIYLWKSHFEKFGTVDNLISKSINRQNYLGRKRVLDEALISRVKEDDENSPKRSTRKRWQAFGISRTALHRVLNFDLHEFPHVIQTYQKLAAND